MSKEVIVVGDKYYFVEDTTGEVFEVILDKKVVPPVEVIKALCDKRDQHART